MALSVGNRLGPYEILAPIGAGGMGEVYRARDSKLNRDVALKLLPPAFARDSERLALPPRGAGARGAESSEHRGDLRTGRERARHGTGGRRDASRAVAVETALDYAGQIADALEAAHERVIVHTI
jgi:serine/threonine protein kinase